MQSLRRPAPRNRWTLRDPKGRSIALTIALCSAAPAHAGAQARYTAAQFDSVSFRHVAQSEIQTVVGGSQLRERIAVLGVLILWGQPAAGDTVRLEAWYDSLAVRRSSREGSLEPDTDGMIGGRYRGRLTADGVYLSNARPFVPDGVAEVVDLSHALEQLLPRLPPRRLGVGASWRDPVGLEIRRLSDSVADGRDTLLRFRARQARIVDSIQARGDTAPIPAKQTIWEEEAFAWHVKRGLVRTDRRVVVDTDIPGGGTVGRHVQSRVEQRITLERLPRGKPPGFGNP